MVKAIFFDLDGVLIDSETVQQGLIQEALLEKGLDIPLEAFVSLIGSHKSLNPWDAIRRDYHIEIKQEELHKIIFGNHRERFNAIDRKSMMFKEVPEVLKQLKEKGILLACASSSSLEYIQTSLNACGIIGYFDLITSSDDFKRSKPAPDIYQYCQDYFKLSDKECLVIEDSPYGIKAGLAAKMTVLARLNPHVPLDQHLATAIINNLNDVMEWL